MNDWFEWNGVRCTKHGMHVLEQPPRTKPSERVTFTDVPGKSGSLTTLQGIDVYDDLLLTAQCILSDPSKITSLCGWLKGSGKVTFANRQGGYYYARIVNQIPFEKILRGNPHRAFAVNFRCKPFWYVNPAPIITLYNATSTVTNPGPVYSEPVFTVYGSGDITLLVDGMFIELTGVNGWITLDTPLMEAYSPSGNANGQMSGEFPALRPGMNGITRTGSVDRIEIQPNWRYL